MDIPFPLLIAITLAAGIWMVVFALRLSTLWACLGVLVSASCFSISFAQFDVGAVTLSIDRLLLVGVVGLAVLKRILAAQPRFEFDRCDAALGTLVLVLALSIWMHDTPPKRTATSPTPTYLFVTSFLAPALLFWVARYRKPSPRDARALSIFFVLFGLYAAFTAVCEVHKLSALVFPQYILKDRALYAGRAVGPALSSPSLGTWLTVAMAAGVMLWNQSRGLARGLLAATFPLFVYAEYLTRTRSAWIGFVVAVPLAALFSGSRLSKQLFVVVLIGVVVVFGLSATEEFLMPERGEGRAVVARSTDQRVALLQRSVALFVQKPLFGWGFGQFEHVSRRYGGGGPIQFVSSDTARGLASHNVLLRLIAETGIVGTIPFVALCWIWLKHTRHALRAAVSANQTGYSTGPTEQPTRLMAILFLCAFIAYAAEAMFHDVTFIKQDNLLIFFLAGCLESLRARSVVAESNPGLVPPFLGSPCPSTTATQGGAALALG